MSTNPLMQSMYPEDDFDENDFCEEVNDELFKKPNTIQKDILTLMKSNVRNQNILRRIASNESSSDEKSNEDNQSKDESSLEEVPPSPEESTDEEDLHEIEKNMKYCKEKISCCDYVTDLFLLKVVIPIFFFVMNISFFCKVYQKEFVSFSLIIFGLIVFGIYIYYIARSACSM